MDWPNIDTTIANAWDWYIKNRENRTPIGAFLGGLLIAGAALRQAAFASRRHYAQTEADRQRRITESYSKAVEQLSGEKIEQRLGGIYTLERISRESPDDYWIIMETLTLTASETRKFWVTIRATLSQDYVGETEHERGSAGTVRGLC